MKILRLFAIVIFAFSSATALAQKNEIIVLAHRGGCGEGMENVLSTFQKSLDAGIKAFELDVRTSKDGKLVLQHDYTLKRTAGIDRAVEDMTEKELREVRLTDGSKLTFLNEVLELFSKYHDLYVEFELKCAKYDEKLLINSGYCDKAAKAILKAQPKGSTYVISSFNTRALRYIKENYPAAEIEYITTKGCNDSTIATAEALGAKRMAARMDKTSRDDIKKAHKKGFIVNLWPGISDDSLVRAWALEADIHCTDYPVHLTQYGREKCKWITIK